MADAKNTRLLPAVPVVDSVPLMVCWALKVTVFVPAADVAVTAKLLKVLEPVIGQEEPDDVAVKLTL